MSKAVVKIQNELDRRKVATWAKNVKAGTVVEFRSQTRSNDQNALMWSLLTQISKQVEWFGKMRSPEDWKDLTTAALRGAEFVPGITPGTIVPLGMRTSQMSAAEISELIESLYAFGAERGVHFRELEVIS